MFFTVLIFLLGGAWFYPITFLVEYDKPRWDIYWLPRVWGGYGRRIPVRSSDDKSDNPKEGKKSPQRALRLIWHMVKKCNCHGLEFMIVPGSIYVKCIFSISVGKFIGISTSALWHELCHKRQRRTYTRRSRNRIIDPNSYDKPA